MPKWGGCWQWLNAFPFIDPQTFSAMQAVNEASIMGETAPNFSKKLNRRLNRFLQLPVWSPMCRQLKRQPLLCLAVTHSLFLLSACPHIHNNLHLSIRCTKCSIISSINIASAALIGICLWKPAFLFTFYLIKNFTEILENSSSEHGTELIRYLS